MLVHRFEAVKDLCPSIPGALPVDLAFDAPLVVAVELSPAEDTSEGIGCSVHHRIQTLCYRSHGVDGQRSVQLQ